MTRPLARYFIEARRGVVQGIFRVGGKRRFKVLCSFQDVHLAPDGSPLPDWTDAQRDAFLGPLWGAADAELQRRHPPAGPDGRAQTLWRAFIAAARADRAPATIQLYEQTLKDYLAANGDHPLEQFSLHHVDRLKTFCKARRHAPHTITQRLNCLRAFLRWAYDREELPRLLRFPNVPMPRRQPSVLTTAELHALVGRVARLVHTGTPANRRAHRHHLRFLMLGLGCGLRRGEILNLRWEQVNLDAGLLTVRITRQFRTKEGREKSVPLPTFLRRYLAIERKVTPRREQWLLDDGMGNPAYAGPHGAHSITTAFRRHLKAIGAAGKGVKPTHGQRALFATELHRAGADAYTIQQLMGHSSIAVTEHYLADPGSAKRRAMDTLRLPQAARSVAPPVAKAPK